MKWGAVALWKEFDRRDAFIYLFIYSFIYLFVYLFSYLVIYLSIYSFIHLFVCFPRSGTLSLPHTEKLHCCRNTTS